MWLLTDRGFYSVVEHREDSALLMVRARVRGDLENLRPLLPGVEILETPEGDYPVRIVVPRADWERAVRALTEGINYDDFKSTVAGLQGLGRHDIYEQVWDVLHDLEGDDTEVGR
jgi:hypothetical protein